MYRLLLKHWFPGVYDEIKEPDNKFLNKIVSLKLQLL